MQLLLALGLLGKSLTSSPKLAVDTFGTLV